MQETLKLEIYKVGEANLKQTVLNKLALKQKFINNKLESPDNEGILDRLQLEQEHLDSVRALLDIQDETIKELKDQLHKSEQWRLKLREINIMVIEDCKDYMEKYYNLMFKKK